MNRPDDIPARKRRLADPVTPVAEARKIASTNPAVVYFSYGVHGNSGSGKVILFIDDKIFRHFWHSTFLPFANAILVGPVCDVTPRLCRYGSIGGHAHCRRRRVLSLRTRR